MSIESKYVALKEYIPMGNPSLSHFDLKSETISLKNDEMNQLKSSIKESNISP